MYEAVLVLKLCNICVNKSDVMIGGFLPTCQIAVGDVIYIEANSGAVKRVGQSDAFATEFDLEAEEYVPLPKGEVHKKKEIVQVFTLNLKTNFMFMQYP